ncbi:MAG: ATP-dependent DNA helicase RecG [Patescibacteria group bacterium]
MIELSTPLSEISGIAPRFLNKLKNLHIETVKDLLWHFPTRYEDFSKIYKIAELIPHQEATITAVVEEVRNRRTWKRNLYMVEADLKDDSGIIKAIWFNQPYIKNVLAPGRTANFSGRVTISKKDEEFYLSNPTYEVLSTHVNQETKHTARIVPIYPETRGLTSKGLRYLIKPLLDNIGELHEIIPFEILRNQKLPDINYALQEVHFPTDIEEAINAKKRFAFEDLLLLQLYNYKQKLERVAEKALPIKTEISRIKKIIEALPFELTPSQKKSLWEIIQDIAKPHPMNRLLQGDVGSGKTVVAAIAAIETAQNNHQTAFMAPTEILAHQHYKTFTKFFPEFESGLALLTSSEAKVFYGHHLETNIKKEQLKKEISNGKVKIIIGTHTLIQKNISFKNLAFVVVDEQHRFGVEQRDTLIKKQKIFPHFLSMSATPIPRTLSLTIFGDLDLSLITEMPKNRKTIITKAVSSTDREKAYAFIRTEIKKGRQVFVICPRIEPKEANETLSAFTLQKLEMKNVKEEYEKLSKKIFPDLRIQMLHGKMPGKVKEQTMRGFSEKKFDIIVATSVVEVGVDIPNASIMMIEGADRFGLAQLYQFRGRVGRDKHQSFCFLFTDSASISTRERLKSIVEAKNGFELAEKDLQIRGPGEFFGKSQTGLPDLAMKAIQNPTFVSESRIAAETILTADPSLKKNPALRLRLQAFQKQIHEE